MNQGATIGTIPPEAKSKGGINATPSDAERDPVGNLPKQDGPNISPEGAYLPAEYGLTREMVNIKGEVVTRTSVRRDR